MTDPTASRPSRLLAALSLTARILGVVSRGGVWVGVGALVVILVLTIADPISRSAGLGQIPFAIPVSVFCMVAVGALSMAATQRAGENPEFTLVMRWVPQRHQWAFRLAGLVVSVAILALTAVATWESVVNSAEVGERSIGTATMLVWPVRFVLFAGIVLLIAECLRTIVDLLVRREGADDHAADEIPHA